MSDITIAFSGELDDDPDHLQVEEILDGDLEFQEWLEGSLELNLEYLEISGENW